MSGTLTNTSDSPRGAGPESEAPGSRSLDVALVHDATVNQRLIQLARGLTSMVILNSTSG